jgi:hypothetical protein
VLQRLAPRRRWRPTGAGRVGRIVAASFVAGLPLTLSASARASLQAHRRTSTLCNGRSVGAPAAINFSR